MVTRSIVGRFLILAVLIVAIGVVAQAALIMSEGGKKAVKTATAEPVSNPQPNETPSPASDPVRVVYPGPLGDTAKLTDTASASPLAPPIPQTTAKLAQAMGGTAAPAPKSTPDTDASVAAAPAASDLSATPVMPAAPLETAAVVEPTPTTAPGDAPPAPPHPGSTPIRRTEAASPTPAGVEVASLGGSVPDSASRGGVNINTATVETLNRLGGGHIGQSIASHRPYRSVEDLITKRILRRSVFNQIKGQLAAQ